jgi:iron-sulfur cluster assembly accessory protein
LGSGAESDPAVGRLRGVITLTPRAAEKIRSLAAQDSAARVLRVAVEGGGCSGFQYTVGFDTGAEPDDFDVESHGVHVVIDRISAPYFSGSTLDYVDGLMSAGFSFDNPNVASTCGCNASFQAKEGVEGPYSPKADGCGPKAGEVPDTPASSPRSETD